MSVLSLWKSESSVRQRHPEGEGQEQPLIAEAVINSGDASWWPRTASPYRTHFRPKSKDHSFGRRRLELKSLLALTQGPAFMQQKAHSSSRHRGRGHEVNIKLT